MLRIRLINNTIRNIQIQQYTINIQKIHMNTSIELLRVKVKPRYSSQLNLTKLLNHKNKNNHTQMTDSVKPELDKSKNYAVFRFLPAVK